MSVPVDLGLARDMQCRSYSNPETVTNVTSADDFLGRAWISSTRLECWEQILPRLLVQDLEELTAEGAGRKLRSFGGASFGMRTPRCLTNHCVDDREIPRNETSLYNMLSSIARIHEGMNRWPLDHSYYVVVS
jgi:hypothetical protein